MRGGMREREPGRWELRVELGRDAVTGRRRQLSRSIRGTKRDAEAALAKLVTEVGDGQHNGADSTMRELTARWLDLAADDLSPTTLRRYRGLVDRCILPALGARRVHTIRASELDSLYLALVRDHDLAPATVRQIHAVIRRALGQAVRWGWIAANPATNTSPPRSRPRGIHPPTPVDVVRLIQQADLDDPDFACFLRMAAATGARRGELCALRWSHIASVPPSVTIGRAIIEVPGGVVEKETKTHSIRRIALDVDTMATLEAHRARVLTRAERAEVEVALDAFVFSLDPDCRRPWAPDRVTKRFVSLRDRMAMPQLRLHDLRHFAATRLLSAGVPVRTVAGRLGHANAATTLSVYAHFLEESDAHAAEVMQGLLRTNVAS